MPVGQHDEVNMRRAVRVAAGRGQEVSDGAVVGDGVVPRHDAAEPESSVVVCGEQPPQIAFRLHVWLLHVVEALSVGLPYVDGGAGQGAAVGAGDAAGDQAGLPGAVEGDGVAEFALW